MPNITKDQLDADLHAHVITPILNRYTIDANRYTLTVNGTGIWHNGGPASDAGLTGRKIVVDTYGGYARVGGGAFSGKDPSKVDRSGAYAARYIAKNIVAHGLADFRVIEFRASQRAGDIQKRIGHYDRERPIRR